MRVLEIVADGRPGGGTTVVLTLLENLRHKTTHLTHFICQEGSYALRRAAELGVETHGVNFGAGRFSPKIWSALAATIKQVRPDLIHAHGARAGLPLSFLGRIRPGIPLVYTVHGYHFLHKRPGLRQLGAMAERRCHAAAAVTIWVSDHDRSIARRWRLIGEGKMGQVIQNGLELGDLPQATAPDERLIAFLGRLHFQKHPEILVDMMVHLAPEGFRLVYIGGGELEETVRLRAHERGVAHAIEITGLLDRKTALSTLAHAGCMVLPSRWEGLPIAPIEAMAMGVPVVASRRGGTPEVVGHEGGILVDHQDAGLYAEAIRSLVHEPQRRHALIRAARKRAESLFTNEVMFRKHLSIYECLGA